jgi:hypothetical protein
MAFLIERPADPQPSASRMEGDVLLIGRGTNAGLRLDDEAVALEHAKIERDPAGYKLVDLGSVTGTYLNGKAVEDATYIKDGDVLGIGGSRLRVRWRSPGDPLALEVRPAVAESVAGPAAVRAPEVNYAGAYILRRPFLTKGALALFFTVVAAGALAALPFTKAWKAFQPGETSEKHRGQGVGCFDCHAPWQGPATTSCSASACHPREEHQPRQAFNPDCSDCHFEHRGQKRLTFVNDASCVACHADLRVEGGGEPAFARDVTAFPLGHADFSVTLAGGGRLPLAEAVSRQADPGGVRLNHTYHLKPGLIGPEGRETLICASCHQPGPGATGMKAVNFEQHCQRCHRLTFDDARPDKEVLHGEPREVYSDLVSIYQLDEGRMGSLRGRRQLSVRRPRADLGLNVSTSIRRQVEEAENHVYRSACVKCHEVDLDAKPVPTVARSRIQSEWLPFSHFDHGKHLEMQIKGLSCETCHAGAAASMVTADVLLSGIATCGGCHGGGETPGKAELRSARNDCRECHAYHPEKEKS